MEGLSCVPVASMPYCPGCGRSGQRQRERRRLRLRLHSPPLTVRLAPDSPSRRSFRADDRRAVNDEGSAHLDGSIGASRRDSANAGLVGDGAGGVLADRPGSVQGLAVEVDGDARRRRACTRSTAMGAISVASPIRVSVPARLRNPVNCIAHRAHSIHGIAVFVGHLDLVGIGGLGHHERAFVASLSIAISHESVLKRIGSESASVTVTVAFFQIRGPSRTCRRRCAFCRNRS